MPHQDGKAKGVTPFEQRLTQLTPSQSIDSERLMFAAGQAETATRMRHSQSRWKALACCTSAATMLLSISLASSLKTADTLRQNEIALRSQLDGQISHPMDGQLDDRSDEALSKPEFKKRENAIWNDANLADGKTLQPQSARSPFLTVGDRQLRSLDTEIASLPVRSRATIGKSSFSFGDFRRMSVVNDEQDRLRHLDSLRP